MDRTELTASLRELADFIDAHELDVIGRPLIQVLNPPLHLFLGCDHEHAEGFVQLARWFGPTRLITLCTPLEWAKTLHPCSGSDMPADAA